MAYQERIQRDMNNLPDDIDQIKDMLEEIDAELMDISQQLSDYYDAPEEGLDDEDHDWARRAENARKYRYRISAKQKRKLRDMEAALLADQSEVVALDRVAVAETKMAEQQIKKQRLHEQAEIIKDLQERRRSIKAANIEASTIKDRAEYLKVKAFLRESHPDVYGQVIAMLQDYGQEKIAAE